MKFHYAGKYDGNEENLPHREHPENAVPFKELSMKQLGIVGNLGACVIIFILAIPFFILARPYIDNQFPLTIACILSVLTLIPHEFLHGLCFKEDVYMYNYLKRGLMFVIGAEDMSKTRFILMSLCPNIIFGFIPYILFLFFNQLTGFGFFGLLCIGMGFGDYINVFNAMIQMPAKSKTYIYGTHSYWYIPENN